MRILQMSFSAGMLILAIFVIRSLAINRLPKKTFVALWGIVLLRLLVPITIPVKINIGDTLGGRILVENVDKTANALDLNYVVSGLMQGQMETSPQAANIFSTLYVVWVIGAIILLLFFLVSYIRSYRKLQEALPLEDNELLNAWLHENQLRRTIKLRVSDRISTPITYGIFSPKIVLPKMMCLTDNKQIEYVMSHELIHIKRFDNLWKIVSIIAVCVHWFNPLVWVMYVLFNRDLEISCDEEVISILGENNKEAYALALINLAEKRASISLFYNGFGKNSIQERIVSIMKYKKTKVLGFGCAIILVLAASIVFAVPTLSTGESSMPLITTSTNAIYAKLDVPSIEEITLNGYPVNEFGETYGPDIYDSILPEPDLILAEGVNGVKGYVKASDLSPEVKSIEEALAYNKQHKGGRYIPLYLQDGKTIIGEFYISN
ncbi:M56 family metallopeptidase [Proteiniborus sp. MB09-C3]|uniref:M56 family metallopeptidase n=1 Tax=Proteiniborus sp. MB09-C3 TaxID=3050072 RepID=UPI0025537209|nr:M56 family metallopeptidase [Proteiniborus sp. MB09-C3]WIV11777.1 M56 family metallopeptidase [Proteiniborus sp. MB09-C3]